MTNEIKDGHRGRLRAKFLEEGLQKFTEAEILELLLTFGTPRRDCKQLARQLIKKFGGLRAVFEAKKEHLAQVPGAGPANIVAIKFIHGVAGLYLEQKLIDRPYISSSPEVVIYLRHHMENLSKELFKVIYLTSANMVISLEDASYGSVNGAYVHPREVMERALALKATGLVLAHNHPSGLTEPSKDDINLTRRLVHAANLMEMKVLDHIIVGYGGHGFFSFRDQGLLSRFEIEVQQNYQTPAKPQGALLHEKALATLKNPF